MNVPNDDGQLITLVGSQSNTWQVLYDKLEAALVLSFLENIQLDGSPGGQGTGPAAPTGKMYAWVTVLEGVDPSVVSTVQAVLDTM